MDLFPPQLQIFMKNVAQCNYECKYDLSGDISFEHTTYCTPSILGDGRCNSECGWIECAFDAGDCVQLCFAPPQLQDYTNCTWQQFTNNVCDKGCNNKYCTAYKYNSDFTNAIAAAIDDKPYTADLLQCYNANISESTYNYNESATECWKSSTSNIYLETNVENQIKHCISWWIGDGVCDDACRTDECLQDGNDCDLGCYDDTCSQLHEAWILLNVLVKNNNVTIHNAIVCQDWLSFGVAAIPNVSMNQTSCEQLVINSDYNNDGYINFREFVVIGVQFLSLAVVNDEKAAQMNCSSCVGMLHYNVYRQ
eukprot:UN01103